MVRIISELSGGLGNQLFQLAALFRYSGNQNHQLCVDSHLVSSNRGDKQSQIDVCHGLMIPESEISRDCHRRKYWLKRIKIREFVFRKGPIEFIISPDFSHSINFKFSETLQTIGLRGEWQHSEIDISFVKRIRDLRSQDVNCGSKDIWVHVRRSDYLDIPMQSIFSQLDENYFKESVNYLRGKLGNLKVHFITDDVDFVAEALVPIINNSEICHFEGNAWEILSSHKHPAGVVISNSTFGWWLATLTDSQYVVAPRTWYRNSSINILERLLGPNHERKFKNSKCKSKSQR